MPSPVTFNVEDYFNEFSEASAMAEASRFKTVPPGSYQAQVTKREGRYFELKPGKKGGEYWAVVFGEPGQTTDPSWRKGIQYTADLSNGTGKKLSTIRIEASWEAKRDPMNGKLDKLFTRWEQLTRALFPNMKPEERAAKTSGEVSTALSQYPVKVYISESFQVLAIDGSTKWTTPASEDQLKEFREAGYRAQNFIQSISKA